MHSHSCSNNVEPINQITVCEDNDRHERVDAASAARGVMQTLESVRSKNRFTPIKQMGRMYAKDRSKETARNKRQREARHQESYGEATKRGNRA